MLIDDFSDTTLTSKLGTRWRGVSDKVMGGISEPKVTYARVDATSCLRLSGDVRLENNGGFIQAALDLVPDKHLFDASSYTGLKLVVRGNNEQYGIHLRTPDNIKSWQSYRSQLVATPEWTTVELPFTSFQPYRLETPLDITRLRRLGLVAIGRAFHADLCISRLEFI